MPKPVKIARPRIKELRQVLKGLLTVSIANRQASLSYALAWYDQALPYLIQKQLLPKDANKKLDVAVKCRKQAQGTTIDHEKESGFLMAVRAYEKVCVALKPVSVDVFYKKFQDRKEALEKKQQRMENKFGNIVGILQKAIGNRVKLEVADAQKAIQYNPALTTLSYNRDAVKVMAEQFRKEGLLSVFVDQLDVLCQHAALESDGHGGWQYDANRHLQIEADLLKEFVKFAKTVDAPKKLVKPGIYQVKVKTAQTGTSAQAGTPVQRAPRGSAKGKRILGFLIPGTAIALVYDRLMDEKEHEISEVIAGITIADPVGRVKMLQRKGNANGKVVVTITGNKASLKHAPGEVPGALY